MFDNLLDDLGDNAFLATIIVEELTDSGHRNVNDHKNDHRINKLALIILGPTLLFTVVGVIFIIIMQ